MGKLSPLVKSQYQHSAIGFVTPNARHRGKHADLLANRHAIYKAARNKNTARWSGRPRNWHQVGIVWLNPERSETPHEARGAADALPNEAGGGCPMAGPEHHAI